MVRALFAALAVVLLSWPVAPASAHTRVHRLPTVFVTGYDDAGRTSTGAWAGPGVCAVDPRYIPLGAVVRIPGVGTCRALDTGGAVVGYHVDVWLPTAAACYAVTGYYRGATWSR